VKVSIKKPREVFHFVEIPIQTVFRLSIAFKKVISHDSNRIVPRGADSQHRRKRIIKSRNIILLARIFFFVLFKHLSKYYS